MLGQPLQRVQRYLQTADQLAGADPAKFARAAGGQQIQTDVGRRRAVRHHRLRHQLQVVRWQVVVFSTDAALEEAPGVAGQRPQVRPVLVAEGFNRAAVTASRRPPVNQGRAGPQTEQKHADHRMRAPLRRHRQPDTQQRRLPALLQEKPKVLPGCRLGLGRGGPFQQLATADGHSPHRSRCRVDQQSGLRRQLAELPGGPGQGPYQFLPADMKEVAPRDPPPGRNQARQRAE